METFNIISILLLIPLIPAFIIYKFLPSKTSVKGPLKGLNINLTGAFSGYFLLVLISYSLIYLIKKDDMKKFELDQYQKWKVSGKVETSSPEATKIFIEGQYPKPNRIGERLGLFDALFFVRKVDNLPVAVCIYNEDDGYNIIRISDNPGVKIDSVNNKIILQDTVKLKWINRRMSPR